MKILLIFTLQYYNIIFILFYLKYNFIYTSNKFVKYLAFNKLYIKGNKKLTFGN